MKTDADLKKIYGQAFYAAGVDGAARSACVVVPIVLDLVRDVASVVDVGCGAGVWLAQFKQAGIARILGLDGGSAADHRQLEIEQQEFRSVNLEQQILINEHFDLCVSLEVAEHLLPDSALGFVNNLCDLADVILFSAAIPGQGGTNHINEQWLSYWIDLFSQNEYYPLDILRERIWNDARVEWWYRQNIILFANTVGLQRIAVPKDVACRPMDVVHPNCFQVYRRAPWHYLLTVLRANPRVWKIICRWLPVHAPSEAAFPRG